MRVGTRSLLFGAHQFILHPIFVALAWREIYGRLPRDPRVWVAFVIHDWGYWGMPDMDGWTGGGHPGWAADVMEWLFNHGEECSWDGTEWTMPYWWWFTAGHSRTFIARFELEPSPLMNADKLATAMMPNWLYVALVWLSGEWLEYRDRWVAAGTYPGRPDDGVWAWSRHLQANWARFRDVNATAGRAYGGE